jgi:hypothetical protein
VLKWKSWSASRANGSGFNWLDNCRPNCAHGKFTLYPVTFKLSDPRHEHHHFVFTRMIVTYTGSKPGQAASRGLEALPQRRLLELVLAGRVGPSPTRRVLRARY